MVRHRDQNVNVGFTKIQVPQKQNTQLHDMAHPLQITYGLTVAWLGRSDDLRYAAATKMSMWDLKKTSPEKKPSAVDVPFLQGFSSFSSMLARKQHTLDGTTTTCSIGQLSHHQLLD